MDTEQKLRIMLSSLQQLTLITEQLLQECEASNENPAGRQSEAADVAAADAAADYETIYPLCMAPGFFKGKIAVAVIFPNHVRVETPTWKKVAETVMKNCNSNPEKHAVLMDLRDRVQGRSRQLLSSRKENMRSPVKIDRGLYMETHYDTENLLRILTVRILDAVSYDYRDIQVAVRNQ